jgi:hypothetical protein
MKAVNRLLIIGAFFGTAALLVWTLLETPWIDNRVYRIGWEDDPPDQFLASNGQPTGLPVELIAESARRCGVRLLWVRHNESSEAALRSGQVDLWPLMTITVEQSHGILRRQRPQEQRVGEAEDRPVRADGEREREHCDRDKCDCLLSARSE